jgi:Zn-dependent protease with chaperone function
MSTSFFQQQDTAHRNTARLVILFVLSILALIALTYFVCLGIFIYTESDGKTTPSLFQPMLLLGVATGVVALVGCGSLYKIAQLSSGGSAVALMLGGREIQGNTRDLRERRLLNIVEEMSIASGVPMPPVYVLPDEKGINAFAAGHAPGDAVVAVSQGSLDYLTRDELQGVVGHEFSHILNGDMRLNIRLLGLIHGLVLISIVGFYLMHVRGSSSDKDKSGAQIALLGIALYILGSIGAFFGLLIQAAVSRQREFLADASATQFTRNPDGIGGALKKIGGLEEGSKIKNGHAMEANHMFFADGLTNRFLSLLASHPPLGERIRQIDPNWDGTYPEVQPVDVEVEEPKREKGAPRPPLSIPGIPQMPLPVAAPAVALAAGATIDQVGVPTGEGLDAASAFTAGITPELREVIGEPFSARAAIYALLLDDHAEVRARQVERLQAEADPRDVAETLRLESAERAIPEGTRLTLAHLALPALRRMSPRQYQVFRSQIDHLIAADERVSLFEFCLERVVCRYLDRAFGESRPPQMRYRSAEQLTAAAECVLGLLARKGQDDESAAARAFAAGMREWQGDAATGGKPERSGLREFGAALDQFAQAVPQLKQKLLRGCVACIVADRQVTATEYELLRTICSSLDVPLPPLAAKAT